MQKSNKLIPVLAGVILTIAILTSVLIVLNRGEDGVANEPAGEGNTTINESAQSSSTVASDPADCQPEEVFRGNQCIDSRDLIKTDENYLPNDYGSYTDYSGAVMDHSNFSGASLDHSDFTGTNLSTSEFKDSNFENSWFGNVDFRNATLDSVKTNGEGYEACVISTQYYNSDGSEKADDVFAWILTCDGEVFTWQRQ